MRACESSSTKYARAIRRIAYVIFTPRIEKRSRKSKGPNLGDLQSYQACSAFGMP